jgi:hypothetical protein
VEVWFSSEAPNIEMPRVVQLAPASGKSQAFLVATRFGAHGSLEKTVAARRARPSFRPPANICSIKIRRALTGVRLLMHYAEVEDADLGWHQEVWLVGNASGLRGSVMDYAVKEVAPQVWHVDIAGAVRIIRYRPDSRTFAPWDICTAEGRRLWASASLESAFRWIEARTGHPAEALLMEELLEQTASNRSLETQKASESIAEQEELGTDIAIPGLRR